MTSFIPYLVKLSICLAVIYLFYQLVLRRLTFYVWNRWYLLIYSVLAFYLPFIDLMPVLEQTKWSGNELIKLIPAVGDYKLMQVTYTAIAEQRDWSFIIIITCLCMGMLFMFVRLGIQYVSLLRLRRSAQLIIDSDVKVYQVNRPIIPFSFGNAIYVNQHQHNEEELKEIIRHEFVHVKQRHSLDIVWMELFCLLNWYNPFAWLIRKSMRQNLEFIADRHVLQNGFDRKQYQYLLLKVVGVSSFSIASNFNFSSLKKRIAMMNKTKSASVHLMRFLFILPLLVVVLLAFRNTVQHHRGNGNAISVTDTIPGKNYSWDDKVESMTVRNSKKVTITLKDGQIEKYDMDNTEERKAFEKKYGKLPPPPPAPPAEAFELAAPVPDANMEPLAPVSIDTLDCINKKGYCVTVADNMGECVIIVKDRNMKIVEAVKMTDWNNDKKFEEKYGDILPPPPPPLPPPPPMPGTAPTPPRKGRASAAVSGSGAASGSNSYTIKGDGYTISADSYIIKGDNEVQATGVGRAGVGSPAIAATGVGRASILEDVEVTGAPAIASGGVGGTIGGEEEIVAVIRSTDTQENLNKIKKDLQEKGYTLKFENVEYKDGKLIDFSGSVSDNHGGKWHFSTTAFKKIVLSVYKTDKGRKGLNVRVTDGKVRI